MNWWLAVAFLGVSFIVTQFFALIYYSKAVSAAGKVEIELVYGVYSREKHYWKLWNSRSPEVWPLMQKHKIFLLISCLLLPAIATCVFNAPTPKIN